MVFQDFFRQRFEDFYYNPDVIVIALFLLVFFIIFSIAGKVNLFGGNRKISALISFVISLMFIFYVWSEISYFFASFNALLFLVIIVLIFVLFRPFLRFIRGQ